jgi:hypothetical protein
MITWARINERVIANALIEKRSTGANSRHFVQLTTVRVPVRLEK